MLQFSEAVPEKEEMHKAGSSFHSSELDWGGLNSKLHLRNLRFLDKKHPVWKPDLTLSGGVDANARGRVAAPG